METLKKLFTNFKKHSKIYIAFAMIITCVFGVMFATNTFAYNTNDNYAISSTIQNITNSNFTSLESKSINNGNNTKPYLEFKDSTNTYNNFTFNIMLDDNVNVNLREYTLLLNYDFGYYSSSTNSWVSFTNSSSYIQFLSSAGGTTANWSSSYLMSNFSTDTDFNYQYRTFIGQYNNASGFYYVTINNQSNISFSLRDPQTSSNRYLRIYNIDLVKNDEITLTSYYSSIQEQYNQLLEDYEDLETDYTQLNNDYTQLNNDYTQLQNDYDELERNRLQILSAFDGCSVQLFDYSNSLIMTESLSLPDGANYINLDNLPNIKSYLSNYENNTYFYLIFNLNYSINNSLLFTFNNSVLEVDVTISSSLNTFVETKSNMFNNANLYQLVINENYNSFNKIKFDGIYTPDYWNNLNISITIDGASYQNGYRDGLHEAEIIQGAYDDLYVRFRELTQQYEDLLSHSDFSYDDGYNDGFNDAINNEFSTSGLNTLFNAILSYPVNFIKQVFNFNFMGVNIAGLITFILSIGIVAFIINYFRKH